MYRFNGPSDKSSSDLYGTDEDVNYNEPDPKEAKHVVFVIIGKGRTPEEEELQAKATNQIKKAFKIQDPDNSSKVIFMPINWTLGLNLSQETMESIKPSCSLDMQRMRRNFEDALFDVVFYVAPIFFAEIQLSLTEELSKAWKTLSDKGFQGKVSLMANGLASVMVYDTITGNDPPKAVNPVYIPRSYDSGEVNELFQELGEARGSVGDVKGRISSFCAKNLDFSIANIFLLGSPIGMFMAMRGIRAGELKLPYNTKVFNIYDQSDIFAYRLDPLISQEPTEAITLRQNTDFFESYPQGFDNRRDFVIDAPSFKFIGPTKPHIAYWKSEALSQFLHTVLRN